LEQVPEGSEEEAHGAHQEAAQGGGCLVYFCSEFSSELCDAMLV